MRKASRIRGDVTSGPKCEIRHCQKNCQRKRFFGTGSVWEFHQRSWWIVNSRPTPKQSLCGNQIPPTQSVDSFILSLMAPGSMLRTILSQARYEPSTDCVGGILRAPWASVGRQRINNPPTALVVFQTAPAPVFPKPQISRLCTLVQVARSELVTPPA